MFVSDAGSPYSRFRRALQTGNLTIIRAAAAELPVIRLDDALQVCVLLRDREPERYERAAVRWIGRYCVERPEVTLEDVDHARAAFALMRRDPAGALAILQALCAPHGVVR
jgi:predicted transport protein